MEKSSILLCQETQDFTIQNGSKNKLNHGLVGILNRDLIILGGASGVDYLVEKWANEKGIPMAIFSEAWNEPRGGLKDPGRPEASPTMGDKMLERATHFIAFPGPKSKWTTIMINKAIDKGIPIVSLPTHKK